MDMSVVVAAYTPRGIEDAAAGFARDVVGAVGPAGPARARSLLWVCSRLGQWGIGVGLSPSADVLLGPSVIERFCAVGLGDASAGARRTARTDLRFVARALGLSPLPEPARLGRSAAKAPYSPAEVASLFALTRHQSTEARRQRLTGLLCLGLGAGVVRGELRGVTGRHVVCRSGGVVVVVQGARPRAVPVLARYQAPLLAAAAHAGDRFICGGVSPSRRNLTTPLLDSVVGDVGRVDAGRLRATWLAEQLGRLGVSDLVRAAGVSHAQRIWDLAAGLAVGDEAALIGRLG